MAQMLHKIFNTNTFYISFTSGPQNEYGWLCASLVRFPLPKEIALFQQDLTNVEEKTYGQICEFGSGFVYEGRIRLGSEYSDPGQSLIDIEREFFFQVESGCYSF